MDKSEAEKVQGIIIKLSSRSFVLFASANVCAAPSSSHFLRNRRERGDGYHLALFDDLLKIGFDNGSYWEILRTHWNEIELSAGSAHK
jgi:hypothetical protein